MWERSTRTSVTKQELQADFCWLPGHHGLKLEFDFDSQRLSKVLGAIAVCIAEPELNVQFTVKDKGSSRCRPAG